MEKTFPNIFSWYGMHLLLQIHQIIHPAIEGRFIVSCPDLSWTFALARMPPSLTLSGNGGISGTEMVHDKSGQDTINRPSIADAVNHGCFSVHQLREYYLKFDGFKNAKRTSAHLILVLLAFERPAQLFLSCPSSGRRLRLSHDWCVADACWGWV